MDLRPDRCDVHRYVRDLEEVLDSSGRWVRGRRGARAGVDRGLGRANEKLAAIGVRIARWVTSHGFALNVSTNLAHFN